MDGLQEWALVTGDPMAPSGSTVTLPDGQVVNVGTFVAYVRYRYRIGRLPEHRSSELESIPGWTWSALRPGPKGEADRNAEIRKKRKEGMTLTELADEYGMSRQRIHQIAPERPDPTMYRARLAHRRANIRAQRKAERDAAASRWSR
ncbi:MAG: Mor transcription activator family [Actinomycetota bacterium]